MPKPKKAAKPRAATKSKPKPKAKPKAAAKKPAANRPPEPEIQVNRVTETTSPNDAREEQGMKSVEPYQPRRQPLENAGLDQHAAEERRQAELDAERDKHNRLTAGYAKS